MIFHSSNCKNRNVELFANTGCVSPHSGPKFSRHKFLAIFGAEHNVNHILRVCVGHVSHLRRWDHLSTQPLRAGLISGTPPAFVESESAYLRVRIVYHIINYLQSYYTCVTIFCDTWASTRPHSLLFPLDLFPFWTSDEGCPS